ncbi:putative pilin/flagellin [Halanaeroarchaeum sp. HSR-CO]|uniref:DUF7289 family protein n=1 Tax=Halanaeroarchaeum sp. HSR-CO TaxID=2866382 RepID=UPI00217DA4F4|nr:hypothetical protein [Halanaeroarchaeum sp. HSR-CO]UWG47715.1 putative pilin/flagellin [Halanaeroarchaeum sp. HSR-CO]
MTSRGVSDVLGYALIFALIISMVGLVYTMGVGGLNDVRESEKLSNAERAFDVLDANIADLTRGTAQSRGTEIKLQDAALDFGDPVAINVTVADEGSYEATLTPIYFAGDDEGSKIVSANGAVFREGADGAVMRSEPTFVFGEKTVVPMVVTRTRDSGRTGSGRVLVRTVVADRSVVHLPAEGANVTITVASPRADAWADHLSAESDGTCEVTGNEVTCTVVADDVYVQVVRVDVTLI